MEIILITYYTSLALFWGIILGKYLYDKGYNEREKEFQENPIIYKIGAENAMWIKNVNSDGKVKVKIYNEKLIEFIN